MKCNIRNESNGILIDNAYDPDLNIFSKDVKNLDTVCVLPEDFHDSLEKSTNRLLLIPTLIVKASKIFLKISKLFCLLWFLHSELCFSETWCDDFDNFVHDFPNYTSNHQKKSDRKGGSVCLHS